MLHISTLLSRQRRNWWLFTSCRQLPPRMSSSLVECEIYVQWNGMGGMHSLMLDYTFIRHSLSSLKAHHWHYKAAKVKNNTYTALDWINSHKQWLRVSEFCTVRTVMISLEGSFFLVEYVLTDRIDHACSVFRLSNQSKSRGIGKSKSIRDMWANSRNPTFLPERQYSVESSRIVACGCWFQQLFYL